MSDWADEKAREWLNEHSDAWHNIFVGDDEAPASLAALLREVDKVSACRIITNAEWDKVKRETLLAEVRRVVEEQIGKWESHSVAPIALRDVLSSLEKL